MAFTVKRLPEILSDMLNWIIANQDKVTDFNEGSVIRSFCESVGIQIEEFYIKARLGFDKYLLNIPFNAFNFNYLEGIYSTGNEKFTRIGTSGILPIPSGTVVSTETGIMFKTTAAGEISSGQTTSLDIPIIAKEIGKDGDVPSGSINNLVTSINNITSVTNTLATTNGLDKETEAQYKERFVEFIEGLGGSNTQGLIATAKKATGVRSASFVEHFPPVSTYNITIYVDDGSGEASAAMLAEVENLLIGDGTGTYPGAKGGGINLRVLAPTKVTVNITCQITDDGTISEEAIKYNTELALTEYITGLLIGEDVILNSIRKTIMDQIGVTDVSVTVPSSNTPIGSNQIAAIGTITITFA
jgi:uncharacterized phage protein gp47/JayE